MRRVQGNPVRYFLFRKDGKVLFEEHKRFMAVEEYIKNQEKLLLHTYNVVIW